MKGSSYSSWVAAQAPGFFGYPDDDVAIGPDWEEELAFQRARLEASGGGAERGPDLPLEDLPY